jgi:hypothetical protein
MYNRVISLVLGGGAVVFVLLLAGAGSGWVTDDPPAVSPYASGPTAAGEPRFVITAVSFGGEGVVEITNVGDAAGSLDGHWICQFPAYFEASGQLAPGASARFDAAASSFGPLDAATGEIGLYTSNSFGDSSAIIAYVEWGDPGHARSGVAIQAAVWEEASAVSSSGAAMIVATEEQPTSAAGWSSG